MIVSRNVSVGGCLAATVIQTPWINSWLYNFHFPVCLTDQITQKDFMSMLTQWSSLRGWMCGGPFCHQLKPRDDTTSVIFPTDFNRVCFTSSASSSEPEDRCNFLWNKSTHAEQRCPMRAHRTARKKDLPTFPTRVVRLPLVGGDTKPLSLSSLFLSLEITATLKPL